MSSGRVKCKITVAYKTPVNLSSCWEQSACKHERTEGRPLGGTLGQHVKSLGHKRIWTAVSRKTVDWVPCQSSC